MSTSHSHAAFNPNHLDEATVVRALARGEHAEVLTAYFGEVLYPQLVSMAQRALAATGDKLGDKRRVVYLLPGLLGSRLGLRTRRGTQVLWFDPAALVQGKLTELAIGRRRLIKPLGVMLPGYLLLKLALQAAGFTVRSYAYDWRRSIVELGQQLADEWLHDPADEILVVGHSMGGLVARAALKLPGSAKVSRVVQMGTPNQGSFAMLQVLRACYPTVRKLGAVDQRHDTETLTRQVFQSFYSFYEMLPQPAATATNWLDARHWPDDVLRPRTERFMYARRLPKYLAAADQRCHCIVGIDQPTAASAALHHGEFVFDYVGDGDGTVPVALAQWHGAQHWYVPGRHGLLPLLPPVCQAVIELLHGSSTRLLAGQHQPATEVIARHSESALRGQLTGKVRWDRLPLALRRELLEPVIPESFIAAGR